MKHIHKYNFIDIFFGSSVNWTGLSKIDPEKELFLGI